MLRSDGTRFALPGVQPSAANVVTLTIGERFRDWESDPQGQGEAEQWFADRVTRRR